MPVSSPGTKRAQTSPPRCCGLVRDALGLEHPPRKHRPPRCGGLQGASPSSTRISQPERLQQAPSSAGTPGPRAQPLRDFRPPRALQHLQDFWQQGLGGVRGSSVPLQRSQPLLPARPCPSHQRPSAQHRAGRRRHRVKASVAQGPAPAPSPSRAASALRGRGWAASRGEVATVRLPPSGTGSRCSQRGCFLRRWWGRWAHEMAASISSVPRCARGWTTSCPEVGTEGREVIYVLLGSAAHALNFCWAFHRPFLAGLHGTLCLLLRLSNLPVSTHGRGGKWLGWINPTSGIKYGLTKGGGGRKRCSLRSQPRLCSDKASRGLVRTRWEVS